MTRYDFSEIGGYELTPRLTARSSTVISATTSVKRAEKRA